MIIVKCKYFSLISMSLQSEEFVILQVKMNRATSRNFTRSILNKTFHSVICLITFSPRPRRWGPVRRGPEHTQKQHTNHLPLPLYAEPGSEMTHKTTRESSKHPIGEGRFNMRRKVHLFNRELLNIYYVLRQWVPRVHQQMKHCTYGPFSQCGRQRVNK